MTERERSEQGIICHFRIDPQLTADGGVEDLPAVFLIGLPGHDVGPFGGVQVRQLPAETLSKITGIEMVRIISL